MVGLFVIKIFSQQREMRTHIKIAFIATAILAGCASDVANRYYGSAKYQPKLVSEVELLWKKPTRQFTVIADFQSRGETPDDMRKKAASIGADAVIVSILGGHYSKDEQWAGEDRHNNTYTRITGTAIKFN